MPIPLTTPAELKDMARSMTTQFGSPRKLKGALIPTGMDYAVNIRIPVVTDTLDSSWFRTWIGASAETADPKFHMAVVTLREGTSTTAEVAIAIIHVDQSDAGEHPLNLCVKGHFDDGGEAWYGNIVLLEFDIQASGIKSINANHGDLASQCLEQFLTDYWKAKRDGTDLTTAVGGRLGSI
ncbi:hypothetical protein R3P38DRAFT_3237447 [Favolaschia claudopus]|uniref:Uncharacterized protein n=1 Tax=Favolaschia claudopus TaxID=2862362 RepID=A0AAV9ZAX4_9AGAR